MNSMASRRSYSSPAMAAPSLIAAVIAALLGACKDNPPAPQAAGSSAQAAALSGSSSALASGAPGERGSVGSARLLALAKPGGSSPVDKEIEQLEQRIEQAPAKADLWILLGRAWVRKARESADPGFYLNASACADVVLDMQPGDKLALNLRALVLINDHKFADARDLAEQLLGKDPDDVMALGTLSDALLEMGRFQEATVAAQKMMDLKPNLPSYSRASYLRWLQGHTEGAKAAIRQAIDARDSKDPEPGAWTLVQAAVIFWHMGDYSGADKGFDMALQSVRDYPPALVGKGRVALAQGNAARAVELLEGAYKRSPLVETAWLLGDAKQAAGDGAGAADAYALVVKHGRLSDGRTLALFYATKDRDHDEALKLAKAERAIRDDIYTQDTLAWALYRAGKIGEARAAIDTATSLGTKDARLLYHAGAIRIAGGDRAEGEKLVREALRLNPKFDLTGAVEAQKLLEVAPKAASGG